MMATLHSDPKHQVNVGNHYQTSNNYHECLRHSPLKESIEMCTGPDGSQSRILRTAKNDQLT